MQVLIVVKKNILNKKIVENQINLICHPYYIILDIRTLNLVFRKYLRKTRVVNLYDNKIDNWYIQQESSSIIC